MTALRTALTVPVQALWQPRAACARLGFHPPVGWILGSAAVLHALLAIAQWNVVSPVIARDPLFAGWSPAGSGGRGLLVVIAAMAPLAFAVRAWVLGSLLHLAAGGAGRRTWIAWAACTEAVLWLESAATTVVAAGAGAADLTALRAAHLRSGLDLLWPGEGAAWLGGFNVFTVWWAVLVALGMSYLGGTSRRRTICAGILCGAARAGLQALWNTW